MIDEGYVKFRCKWIETKPLPRKQIKELNRWHQKLYQLGLIGVYTDGFGFGNISIRIGRSKQFIISGTQTGGVPRLTTAHYTKVIAGDFKKNCLTCEGPIEASSESLTHLAVYQADQSVKTVIHVHYKKLWKKLLGVVPTISKRISYGTPAMARGVLQLFKETDVKRLKVFVMAGHEEGVVSFGKNLNEAGAIIISKIISI